MTRLVCGVSAADHRSRQKMPTCAPDLDTSDKALQVKHCHFQIWDEGEIRDKCTTLNVSVESKERQRWICKESDIVSLVS